LLNKGGFRLAEAQESPITFASRIMKSAPINTLTFNFSPTRCRHSPILTRHTPINHSFTRPQYRYFGKKYKLWSHQEKKKINLAPGGAMLRALPWGVWYSCS
jgi:hypothetical protein